MSAGLHAHVAVPARGVDVRLDVGPEECVALVGPNGAGKSTIVETLAGLLRVRAGEVVLGGRVLTGVPSHRRRIGLVAQRADLFPHLSVARNVAFGPRASGIAVQEAWHRSDAALAAVGASELADRAPGTLSGGQAQRVAIARALATAPALLLLDEPTSALDVDARTEVRAALRTARSGRPTLLVTHDPLEAVTLADRVVVLEAGRVVEQGPTAAVLGRPTSAFGAAFSGLTLVRGTATRSGIALDGGGELASGTGAAPPGSAALAAYHPTTAVVTRDGAGPERVVTAVEPRDGLVRVRTADLVADVTMSVAAARGIRPGERVRIAVPAEEVAVYEPAGEAAS